MWNKKFEEFRGKTFPSHYQGLQWCSLSDSIDWFSLSSLRRELGRWGWLLNHALLSAAICVGGCLLAIWLVMSPNALSWVGGFHRTGPKTSIEFLVDLTSNIDSLSCSIST